MSFFDSGGSQENTFKARSNDNLPSKSFLPEELRGGSTQNFTQRKSRSQYGPQLMNLQDDDKMDIDLEEVPMNSFMQEFSTLEITPSHKPQTNFNFEDTDEFTYGESEVERSPYGYQRPSTSPNPKIDYKGPNNFYETNQVKRKRFSEPIQNKVLVNDKVWLRCVTIYGFQENQSNVVLKRFSQFGEISKYWMGNGNWINICYRSESGAKKALSKDGLVLNGRVMLGVRPCIERSQQELVKIREIDVKNKVEQKKLLKSQYEDSLREKEVEEDEDYDEYEDYEEEDDGRFGPRSDNWLFSAVGYFFKY